MIRSKTIVLVLVFVASCAFGRSEVDYPKDIVTVSLVELLAVPEKFDGRFVNVKGFLEVGGQFEDSVYLDENSYENGLTFNTVAIDFSDSEIEVHERAKELNLSYVFLIAKFNINNTVWSKGELTDVRIVGSLTPPRHQ